MDGNIDALLQQLKESGFDNERLFKEITLNVLLGRNSFTVDHAIAFGRDIMRYRLFISHANELDDYNLERYTAYYLTPCPLKLGVISGIDTDVLDKKMLEIDWTFHLPLLTQQSTLEAVTAILSDLKSLKESGDPHGVKIQEWLRIKYFSNTIFDDQSLEAIKQNVYITGNYSQYNANVIYYKLSGKTGPLDEMLHDMGLPDMEYQIGLGFSQASDRFEIEVSLPFKKGHVFFKMPFVRNGENYEPEDYHAKLVFHPDIKHSFICNVDTAELEKMFQKIDWKDDYSNVMSFDNHATMYSEPVKSILYQLKKLQENEKGAFHAEQLQLKYWIGAFHFDKLIPERAMKRYASFPAFTATIPKYTPAADAYRSLLDLNRKKLHGKLNPDHKQKSKRMGIR